MISPFQLSDSSVLRTKAQAINSSIHGALDRIVVSLLATKTNTILRSRKEFPTGNGRQTLAEATRRRSDRRTVASRPQPQAP
jgi:hypothetical protein